MLQSDQDSVTVFAIDPVTGRLSYRQNIATEGKQPRFIDVESGGETLVAANELSHTLTRFAIQEDGSLVREPEQLREGSPVCVVWKL